MKIQKKKFKLKNNLNWLVSFLLLCSLSSAQLVELDYSKDKRKESSLRVHFIRQGIIGISSLQHLDLSAEIFKVRYDGKKGAHISFTIYGTQTLWKGNKIDALNTFDFVMNPIGGTANGTFSLAFYFQKNRIPVQKLEYL